MMRIGFQAMLMAAIAGGLPATLSPVAAQATTPPCFTAGGGSEASNRRDLMQDNFERLTRPTLEVGDYRCLLENFKQLPALVKTPVSPGRGSNALPGIWGADGRPVPAFQFRIEEIQVYITDVIKVMEAGDTVAVQRGRAEVAERCLGCHEQFRDPAANTYLPLGNRKSADAAINTLVQ